MQSATQPTRLHITKCIYINPTTLFQTWEYEEDAGIWYLTLFNGKKDILQQRQQMCISSYAYFPDHDADNELNRSIFTDTGVDVIPEVDGPERFTDGNTLLCMPFVAMDTLGYHLKDTNPGVIVMTDINVITDTLLGNSLRDVGKFRDEKGRGKKMPHVQKYGPVQYSRACYRAVDKDVTNRFEICLLSTVDCEPYEAMENLFVYHKKIEQALSEEDLVLRVAALRLDWCNIFRVLTAGTRYQCLWNRGKRG